MTAASPNNYGTISRGDGQVWNVRGSAGAVSYTHLDVYKRQVLEQVSNFEYLGYSVSYNARNDVVNKLHKFNLMCGTITRTLKSASKEFYKVMALPILFYGSEN